jgi:hypothetical protein
MMKQNRAPSPSCASPISGEPTIHFRIGVHSIEKEIKSEGLIIPTQSVTSLGPSHYQQSNPAAHKFQRDHISTHKHRAI